MKEPVGEHGGKDMSGRRFVALAALFAFAFYAVVAAVVVLAIALPLVAGVTVAVAMVGALAGLWRLEQVLQRPSLHKTLSFGGRRFRVSVVVAAFFLAMLLLEVWLISEFVTEGDWSFVWGALILWLLLDGERRPGGHRCPDPAKGDLSSRRPA
ncbi:MAG TPA: hypothetical protein VNA57_07130 [Acidimicrobiales bacterium]|nr:hypothetical protein [Acidimicrobiales bacterium]